jgi:hypothetical protein
MRGCSQGEKKEALLSWGAGLEDCSMQTDAVISTSRMGDDISAHETYIYLP